MPSGLSAAEVVAVALSADMTAALQNCRAGGGGTLIERQFAQLKFAVLRTAGKFAMLNRKISAGHKAAETASASDQPVKLRLWRYNSIN